MLDLLTFFFYIQVMHAITTRVSLSTQDSTVLAFSLGRGTLAVDTALWYIPLDLQDMSRRGSRVLAIVLYLLDGCRSHLYMCVQQGPLVAHQAVFPDFSPDKEKKNRLWSMVNCHQLQVNVLQVGKQYPIAHPYEWAMGHLLLVLNVICVLCHIAMLSTLYYKTSSISRTKFQNLNVSCILMQLSSFNPLKPGVKLKMKMLLEQRRQAMLHLYLSYQLFHCPLGCDLY